MDRIRKIAGATAVILTLGIGLASANGSQEAGATQSSGASAGANKGKVELVYVEWARAVAITHVAGTILQDLGYKVQTNSVANAAMWAAVASGDADALLCAWLPQTHKVFYAKYKNKVIDVGKNYLNAKLGLVVPAYMKNINTVPQLAQNAGEFKNKIIGIDPGAGEMQETEAAIKNNTSGLGKFKLIDGSGPAMTAALGDAIKNHQPIVVTGWKPHWMFGRWDLKILGDPAGIYGKSEHIDTVVNKNLPQSKPGVYKFHSKFDWTQLDLGSVLVDDQNGMDPDKSAQKYVAAHIDKINSLLPAGMHI